MSSNASALLYSILASVLPTLLYVLVVWHADRYEKEPVRLLLIAFGWGAVPAVIGSVVLELLLDRPLMGMAEAYRGLMSMGMITPIVEESLKGLALLGLFYLVRAEFDGVLDGIIYGSVIGFGFAMTENALYFVKAWQEGGLGNWGMVVLMRSVLFGLNHAMYTSATGVGFGLARYSRSRVRQLVAPTLGLAGAIVFHSLHNSFLTLENLCFFSIIADWLGVLMVFTIIVLAWRREKGWLQEQLGEEAERGILSPVQFETIVSKRRRIAKEWELLGIANRRQALLWRRMTRAATELALKKHQRAAMGTEKGQAETIMALRAEILSLRQALGDEGAGALALCTTCGKPSTVSKDWKCPHCS